MYRNQPHQPLTPSSDPLFQQVLRVHPEPFTYLNERSVHHLLTQDPLGYFRFVRNELLDLAYDRAALELPPKRVFSDPDAEGDFRVMPCVVRNAQGARKTVKIVGTNTCQQIVPDQITVGKVLVIHPEENFVSVVMEACLFSSARTGMCAAQAIDLLASSKAKVTVIGAGRVGYYAAFYTAFLSGVREIVLSDSHMQRAQAAAHSLAEQLPAIRFKAEAMEHLEETDVLILATTSKEPLYGPDDFPARVIVSLGADTNTQHELDPRWAGAADLFVDTEESARYGDLHAWLEAGLIHLDQVRDLLALLRNGPPQQSRRPAIFFSTGSALFDNITAGYILHRTADRSIAPIGKTSLEVSL